MLGTVAITNFQTRQAQDHDMAQLLETIEKVTEEEAKQSLGEKKPSRETK